MTSVLAFLRPFIGYIVALIVLVFAGIMFSKVVPYMTFEYAINFLGTKSDATLHKSYYMWAFYVHITSSILVLAGGVFQFFPVLLRGGAKWHRLIGKLYVGSILIFAAPSGLVIAAFANGGLAAKVGFSLQCFVWWFCTFAGWREIMHRRIEAHTVWMWRSFAITLAALSLRTESYFMHYYLGTKPIETYLTVTWLSWVGNLMLVECLLYFGVHKRHLRKVEN